KIPKDKEGKVHVQNLHRIFCDSYMHRHSETIFEDEPQGIETKDVANSGKLQGKKPIQNLEIYLKANPDVSFIIFKEHTCSEKLHRRNEDRDLGSTCPCRNCMQRPRVSIPKPVSARRERMLIVSSVLKEAIARFMTCRPDGYTGPSGDIEMD